MALMTAQDQIVSQLSPVGSTGLTSLITVS